MDRGQTASQNDKKGGQEVHIGQHRLSVRTAKDNLVAHPQANGLVERANRSLIEGIKTRLGRERKGWVDELPNVLWAHRTSLKTSNGEIPYSLTFRSEAGDDNEEEMRLNLDLLTERREATAIREARYKRKVEHGQSGSLVGQGSVIMLSVDGKKDSDPHLTARQEQTVKLLESHKAPFRRYLECFLCLVDLSPFYPFDENSYPDFERPDRTDIGLLDFIKTADTRKVRAVEVQKGDDQVTLLESTRHCFMPLVIPAAGGSSSVVATEVSAPNEGGKEDVAEENAYLELADPDEGTAMVRQSEEEVVTERPKKIKKKRPTRQSDVLPAKKLRTDHPSLTSGTKGKTLAGLEQIMPAGSRLLTREQSATPSVAPPQESVSFVDLSAQVSLQIHTTVGSSRTLSAPVDTAATTTTSTKAKLAADVNPDLAGPSQLKESEGSDDSFYELATFDLSKAKRAARQICLGSEVRSRVEHELELKEKLNAKYAARGRLLEEKDLEILRLKSQLAEKEAEAAEKDNDISLLDSRATHLASSLDDAKVACAEAGTKITSLASERDRLASEEEQAQELYNRVAELEAHVMDVSGQYQGILGHALGRAIDFGIQEGLEAGHEHGVAGRSLSVVDAYNLEVASADYVNAVKALKDTHFPLVDLLKSKKDARMDEHLSIHIHHAGDKTAIEETSISFALMNVHARAKGPKKHVAALRQLMMEIVFAPLSSQTWVGEASISAALLSVEDYAKEDTYEALGSVVAIPRLERCCL
ncbi:reverse transcriptase domain-containing protein [Tanacetum coccineum]